MIFYYRVLIADDVLMAQTLEHIDLLLNGTDILLTNGYFLHRYKTSIVEVDALVNLAVRSLTYLFNELIAFDYFVFAEAVHFHSILQFNIIVFKVYKRLGHNYAKKIAIK